MFYVRDDISKVFLSVGKVAKCVLTSLLKYLPIYIALLVQKLGVEKNCPSISGYFKTTKRLRGGGGP